MPHIFEPTCIVLMPFGNESDEQLFYTLVYDHIIAPACEKAGIRSIRIDKASLGKRPIREELEHNVRSATVAIADVSDNNPNVLFELGMRRGFGGEFVAISKEPSNTTFSANGFQVLNYSQAGAVDRLASALSEALGRKGMENERGLSFATLGTVVREKEAIDNPFQDAMAGWRVRRAAEELRSIQHGVWSFAARSSENYVTYVFAHVLGMLAEHDAYATVTTSAFWRNAAIHETNFLNANVAAAERGAIIRRVFLLDANELLTRSGREEVLNILIGYQRLIQTGTERAQNNLRTRFKICQDFRTQIGKYTHFGLAQRASGAKRNGGSMLIEPTYLPDESGRDRIYQLNMSFPSTGADRHTDSSNLMTRFEELFLGATSLSEVQHALSGDA
jgi:hypothetical protein